MSRKALFTTLSSQSKPVEAPSSRTRPLLGSPDLILDARPVGAVGQSLSEISDRAKRADEIERKLTEGQVIVELDPSLIDPSFVADRMPLSSEGLESLREKIRETGQLNPILVRPHPNTDGRYQVAFGHRRLRAVKDIGRTVRAVVRNLSDEELVVAQGQENHEREDLSYIEKVQFAQRLEKRGFARATIMSALSIYKSDLSNMISVASKLPETLIASIGPAPGIGRRGWIELAELLEGHRRAVDRAIADPAFQDLDSDARFKAVLAATKPQKTKAKAEIWSSAKGETLAKVTHDDERITLAIDRRKAPDFAEFVLNRLRDLYQEFEATRS
ncbi:plasmid partitioning protein RepB [Lichenifustis flavocetrariae]|uniref:Plasmid partitioning protein RepB n=1 Tax=Lichenifustis flavocetrariae TaxID=2949735 RepID=A0AA42CNP6_9HYPH|nr:plasmid partitioning protein RepB [Lichenifustis flavocetrariae]MCW6513021.1 plasmid partitioning protein RepB [Lichenifustis flavocetrariae]